VHFDEPIGADQFADTPPIRPVWRNESRQSNETGIDEEIAHFADAPDIFLPVAFRESKVAAQTVAYVVTVEYVSGATLPMENLFHLMGDCGFS
jgi:hypothetical protein